MGEAVKESKGDEKERKGVGGRVIYQGIYLFMVCAHDKDTDYAINIQTCMYINLYHNHHLSVYDTLTNEDTFYTRTQNAWAARAHENDEYNECCGIQERAVWHVTVIKHGARHN